MDLRGKRALVTGGAVRIGRAICEALAAAGCDVVIHYRQSRDEAEALAAALRRNKAVQAWAAAGELEGEEAAARLMAAACERAGRLDVLVNNAAVFGKADLWSTTEHGALADLRTNLLAPLFLIRAFARQCRTGAPPGPVPGGKVVNLLDRRIVADDTSCVPYLLSKKGLAALTRLAALELAPDVTVNGVAPGPVLPPPGEGEAYLHDKAGRVPLARYPAPADIARAVLFLLESDAVTGQVLFVDGGQHLLGNGV
ncbi:MAG: SDR family oxidoreductase [Kiritimatiellae bacterium]|nr:SDR family oxidoreductase [Kiritimatiellia bacterium]